MNWRKGRSSVELCSEPTRWTKCTMLGMEEWDGVKGLMDLWRDAGMKVGGRGDWRRRVRERQKKRRVAMRVFGWYMMGWF